LSFLSVILRTHVISSQSHIGSVVWGVVCFQVRSILLITDEALLALLLLLLPSLLSLLSSLLVCEEEEEEEEEEGEEEEEEVLKYAASSSSTMRCRPRRSPLLAPVAHGCNDRHLQHVEIGVSLCGVVWCLMCGVVWCGVV
jgi:hypothetical protein